MDEAQPGDSQSSMNSTVAMLMRNTNALISDSFALWSEFIHQNGPQQLIVPILIVRQQGHPRPGILLIYNPFWPEVGIYL